MEDVLSSCSGCCMRDMRQHKREPSRQGAGARQKDNEVTPWSIASIATSRSLRQSACAQQKIKRLPREARPMSIEAVRPSEAQFRALNEHSTDALALLTRDGSIAYASPSMGRVTGYEAGELEGMQGLSLVHPDDQEQVQAALTSIRNQPGASITITYRLRLREGTFRWIENA